MALHELENELMRSHQIFSRHDADNETLFNCYWDILCDYLSNKKSISYAELEIFNAFFPDFTERIKCHCASKADVIRFAHITNRKSCIQTLQTIESAAPNVLYLKSMSRNYIRTNTCFIPFGKYETAKGTSYFHDALTETATPQQNLIDSHYIFFKAFIYTNFVLEHTDSEHPFHYITEEALNNLREKYPEFTERFEDEALEYLDSLGFYDAFAKFATSKFDELTELANLSPAEAAQLVIITINGRQVQIEYD